MSEVMKEMGRSFETERVPRLVLVLLLLFAGLFVYAPVFHGDWLWDDDSEVTEHGALHTLPGLLDIWQAKGSPDFLPVKSTVQWVVYRFVGKEPVGWHLVNIGFHLLSGFLLWRILGRLGMRYAWVGGLLWVVHPFAVESVAWISELKNTLSLVLYLLAFLRFLDFLEGGRWKDWGLAVGFFVLSVFSKSSGVMFPFVLLLLIGWERGGGKVLCWDGKGWGGARLVERVSGRVAEWVRIGWVVMPFFLVSLVAGISTLYFQRSRAIGPETLPIGGVFERMILSGQASWFYLYKEVLPFGLLPNYERWNLTEPSIWQWMAWPGMLILFGVCWMYRRGWGRHALLGLGFFLVNLVPVMGFFQMSYMRITWVSDHLGYLSLVGVVGLVAAASVWVFEEAERRVRPFFAKVGAVLVVILAVSAHQYAAVFTSEEVMWKYTLRSNPDAWQAHSRLARELGRRGHHGVAAYHVGESLRLRPDLPETHHNYAAVLFAKGEVEESIAEYRVAIGMAPYADMFRVNLANALSRAGKYQEAESILLEIKEKHPRHPVLLNNLGGVLYQQGRMTEAIRYFKNALEINPNLPTAQENLGFAIRAQQQARTQGVREEEGKIRFLDTDVPLMLSQPRSE